MNKRIIQNVEITIEEQKKLLLEILDVVHSFCTKKGITYFLSSGTLLGAIRHKGFIPWDDDIDLYMPRDSYERFLDIFNSEIGSEDYRVVSLKTDPLYSLAYAKVERRGTRVIERVDYPIQIGVNIDIFPVDGVPDDQALRKRYFKRIQLLRYKLILKEVSVDFKNRGLIKNSLLLLGKLFLINKSVRSLSENLDSAILKNIQDSQFVCNMVLGNGIDSVFSRSSIAGCTQVQFEGKMYNTMIGFDEYLSKTYGDYMTMPPENKRVTHHTFSAFWVNC